MLLMSTAFYLWTDGVTKWVNHSTGQVLGLVIRDNQKDWVDKCPMVEVALNSNVSATIGFVSGDDLLIERNTKK